VLEAKNDLVQLAPHRYLENDLLQLLSHRYVLLYCMFAPVAAHPQCSYVKIHLEICQKRPRVCQKRPCESAILTMSRSHVQGSFA